MKPCQENTIHQLSFDRALEVHPNSLSIRYVTALPSSQLEFSTVDLLV